MKLEELFILLFSAIAMITIYLILSSIDKSNCKVGSYAEYQGELYQIKWTYLEHCGFWVKEESGKRWITK